MYQANRSFLRAGALCLRYPLINYYTQFRIIYPLILAVSSRNLAHLSELANLEALNTRDPFGHWSSFQNAAFMRMLFQNHGRKNYRP